MTLPLLCLAAALAGYLLGGVNPAIVLSRAVYHEDIRTRGSGNPGFTNFKRVYPGAAAWLVLALDIAKTALPVWAFSALFRRLFSLGQLGAALTGFGCMLGHAYPVWYRFRGGKSFIACFATVWFVDWRVGLCYLGVAAVLLAAARIMSLASVAAAASYPVSLAFFGFAPWTVELLAAASAALVIYRHRANLRRIAAGTEPRFTLRSRGAH